MTEHNQADQIQGQQTQGREFDRQTRISVLAKADAKALFDHWAQLGLDPKCKLLRGPETGLIALRGRIGGGGAPFNFGEATLTRATVQLESGQIGHAATLGRNHAKAKLAAVIDALAEDPSHSQAIQETILSPLAQAADQRDATRSAEAAATKVEFFTMERGED